MDTESPVKVAPEWLSLGEVARVVSLGRDEAKAVRGLCHVSVFQRQ